MAGRAGMVLDTGDGLRFVSAREAGWVVPSEAVVPVPGMVLPAVGLVLTEERVATALRVGTVDAGHMVVCDTESGWVALMGARVTATGLFCEAEDGVGVVHHGQVVLELDVRGLTLDVEAAIWRAAWPAGEERLS